MMPDILRKFYPGTITASDFILRTYRALEPQGITPEKIMLAHSICSDDINSIAYPEVGRQMLGPFNLGGVNGFPFTGLTGMAAFAHHVPEDGAAMVFYAPHIGICAEGEPGKIRRIGQPGPSTCCGAVALALQRIDQERNANPKEPFDDFQQHTLEHFLFEEKSRISAASNPFLEATDIIFEQSGKQIDHLVGSTAFKGRYLFVIGAIIINTDWPGSSYLEVRRFEEWDIKTRKFIRNVKY